jgi:hypothetical protein
VFNGSSWDRLRGTTGTGILVSSSKRAEGAGNQGAVTVSNVAPVQIVPVNNFRERVVITNNGTGILYLGAGAVAASGANMGLKILPGGSYEGYATFAYYGIYSEAAASQNVSYLDTGDWT